MKKHALWGATVEYIATPGDRETRNPGRKNALEGVRP